MTARAARVRERGRPAAIAIARGLGAAALSTILAVPAHAAPAAIEPPRAVFALIVGVNASPEVGVAPLQYADDDAARYLDLFRALGARTYVLSRLDENTRRLHPQAAAEAVAPRRPELRQAVETLARDVAQARARGVKSTLYFVYAGHGDAGDAGWHLTLEDDRLSGGELMSDVVGRVGADQSHVIIDACHAYLLALPRGPGGARRPVGGFVELEAAARAGRVGYVLSSSVSGETHEWAGFEAGVFSHEVRSGLYGAADADGDGRVTYAEIAAFVARANQAITGERFRPRVLARAPREDDMLLDLRGRRDHELRMEGRTSAAHYLLEDENGVRLADFHGTGAAPIHLITPAGDGPLYLRRLDDDSERTIVRRDGVIELAALPAVPARARARGAAHQAFSQIFALAFDGAEVARWERNDADEIARFSAALRARDSEASHARLRRLTGWSAVGLGVAALLGATGVELSARSLHDASPPGESQRDTIARNDRIDTRNHWALGLGAGAAALGLGGATLLLWPSHPTAMPQVDVALSPVDGRIGARWRF